ncbi:unnamed protein product [Rotaria sp. Silwood2]|nr:unnamed protein product [Rotaria sp. Silwood2]CAF4165607.1 unnamed protein product [Rotaria sp. Silwood2]
MFFFVNYIIGQDTISSQPTSCGCCPSPYCQAKSTPCSTNSDCECLMMAMTGGGMCTDTVMSCKDLVPCQNDNKTCSAANTGTCQPLGNSFFCLCPSTHFGPVCEYRGTGTDLTVLETILNGSLTNYDQTVENVLNRSNWTNMVAVVDVTGSMQPCAAAVYKWLKLAYDKLNSIKYYVFFNDGDNKADSLKVIGSTGGIYGIPTTNLNTTLAVMQAAMKNGNGGDGPENDIEAILFGIKQCPTCTNLIHIADNQVTPRDMILLSNVTLPVKVITCQLNSYPVNPDLINIASRTGGSIHTLQQDIINLSGIPVNGTIVIGSSTYRRTVNGYVQIA